MKNILKPLFISIGMLCAVGVFIGCKKEESNLSEPSTNPNPQEISPGQGAAGEVLTLKGTGLGGIKMIYFEKDSIEATLNPNFNTDHAVIFRIPDDAIPADQNIVFINYKDVKFTVPFKVLGLPNILEVSNYNFKGNGELTLTGKNFADISEAKFVKDEQAVIQIVSKTATSITLKIPVVEFTQSKLILTNEAGSITSKDDFVNLDKALVLFYEDMEQGLVNGSWGPAEVSSEAAKSGTHSFKMTYNKGNWSANGFANWSGGINVPVEYTYISFWLKGGTSDQTLYITSNTRNVAYGNSDRNTELIVKANKWNYFKLKTADIDQFVNGRNIVQLGFWLPGPDDANQNIYLDDLIFIK
ncbi:MULTISPECIES: cell shape determination protein CcmA [Sphingobacterium]|uniref:cell shape determination protein CcmA n=1 Tax=Sphingobacterium TaxID=28453 RepID=UPI00247AF7DB|nr:MULTISPECIES: cell shape determination protein CcmA [Sphingobacterium]WGQ15675.1 cell shape determination protein CcmA [Sphingobacterium faecium]